MFKTITSIHEANGTASTEQIAKELQAQTGLTIRECREWVKAWVMA